jgi:hypothetical protein
MLQDRLTSLAVLHVHRDIDIDINRVIRSFTLGKSRHVDESSMFVLMDTKYLLFKKLY